ncbi:hypothetical protein F8566_31000 [Actinomadura rudentiformis]|uniref:Uncharacterized protein n=1 Tax=Actinomadura rudentiformis TaxID=359158 RepID=A0A6H9YFN7_9ACTN|nr:hypothetical protein F8566_31000 [Actinomadura rudentiformis]
MRGRRGERDALHPAVDGPDRHGARIHLPGQAPVIERLGGTGPERDRLGLGLAAAPGAFPAQKPGIDLGVQRGVGVSGLTDHMECRLRRQPGRLQLGVDELLQSGAGEHLLLVRHNGHAVGQFVAGVQGRRQRRRLLMRRQQLHLHHQFHDHEHSGPL